MKRMEPFFELIKTDNRGDDSVPRTSHARLYRNGTVVINRVYHDENIGIIDDIYDTFRLDEEEVHKVYGILLSTMGDKLEEPAGKVWYSIYVSDDKDMCILQREGSLENSRLAELAEMFEM